MDGLCAFARSDFESQSQAPRRQSRRVFRRNKYSTLRAMVVFSNVPDNLDLDDEAEEDSNAGPQNVVIKSVLGLEWGWPGSGCGG